MDRDKESGEDRLREALRAGDPALDGCEPDATEFARMRRRMLSAAETTPLPLGLPARVLAAVAVFVLTVALGWSLWNDGLTDRRGATPVSPAARGAADPDVMVVPAVRDPRQIQFSTPGGTRVIWTLDPDFEV